MIPESVLKSINTIANRKELKNARVINDPDVSMNDTRKVLEAVMLFMSVMLSDRDI